jgi:hypothetical protein
MISRDDLIAKLHHHLMPGLTTTVMDTTTLEQIADLFLRWVDTRMADQTKHQAIFGECECDACAPVPLHPVDTGRAEGGEAEIKKLRELLCAVTPDEYLPVDEELADVLRRARASEALPTPPPPAAQRGEGLERLKDQVTEWLATSSADCDHFCGCAHEERIESALDALTQAPEGKG